MKINELFAKPMLNVTLVDELRAGQTLYWRGRQWRIERSSNEAYDFVMYSGGSSALLDRVQVRRGSDEHYYRVIDSANYIGKITAKDFNVVNKK
jgi:hypothetical protein